MECEHCHGQLESGDRFCRSCGRPTRQMRLPALRPEVYPATRAQALPLYLAAGGASLAAAALAGPTLRLVLRVAARALGAWQGSRSRRPPEPPVLVAFLYHRIRIWRP